MTPAPTRALLTRFDALHQQHFQSRAIIAAGKDAANLAKLWRSHGDVVYDWMEAFFQARDPFVEARGYTVGMFVWFAPRLLVKRTTARADYGGWHDECRALHDDRCGNAHFHAAKMRAGQPHT